MRDLAIMSFFLNIWFSKCDHSPFSCFISSAKRWPKWLTRQCGVLGLYLSGLPFFYSICVCWGITWQFSPTIILGRNRMALATSLLFSIYYSQSTQYMPFIFTTGWLLKHPQETRKTIENRTLMRFEYIVLIVRNECMESPC